MSILIDQIYVFNLSDTLVTVLDPNDEVGPYYDAYHLEQLNGENSFSFKVPANNVKSELVVEGNQVAFKDLDGNFQLFEIKIIEEIHAEVITKDVFCEHAVLELLDEIILFEWERNKTATQTLTSALTNTVSGPSRWTVGTVNVPSPTAGTWSVRMELNNPIEVFKKMITAFQGGEFKYRVTISGTSISTRYVDFLQQRGSVTSKRFEYEKDVNSIKREIDLTNVKTALYGFGKAEEVPGGIRRARFDNVTNTDAGITRTKILGVEYLEDTAAKAKWGRAGGTRHRWGYYENPDLLDPIRLLQETDALLDQTIEPEISYEMKVTDLERFSGYAHEKVRLGDTVVVIDRTFKPELYISARILELKRYLTEPEKDELVLGRFRPLITDDGMILRDLQDRVHDKEGVWDDSAYKNNMITDHSFENVPRAGSPDSDQVYAVFKSTPPDGDYGSIFWWQWTGTGYVISSYNETTLKDYNQLALFDYQAAVISTVTGKISHAYQYVPLNITLGLNGPYTISCYVSAFVQTTLNGNAIIEVYACQKDTTRLNSGNPVKTGEVFIIYTDKNIWKRNVVTISDALPSGTELLEVYITTDTSQFKYLVDGVQLVPMNKPMTYEPESNLWKMMRRFPGAKMQYPTILGDVIITGMLSMLKPDTCRAYSTAVQAIPAAAFTKITYDAEDWDLRFTFDLTNDRFVASTDGYYLVTPCVRIDNAPDGNLIAMAIYKNGVILEKIDVKVVGALNDPQLNGASIVQLSATDYIEVWAYSVAAVNTRAGTQETHLKVMKMA